ncbi:hypothetical protein [Myxococcus landrumensis]|uniref:Uncharacterized protein n=1 Tax=Myxococcus landrumensis TaxID=2813577 RepID=A0ABX7N2M2_9BACT|nr:hypothetical protein [Myxococcus landrumus]QSQ12684.1 hypothetical protein JY572_30680 [Myxococcus landrumus]
MRAPPRERTLVDFRRAVALRPAVPLRAVVLLPERTARTGRRVLVTRFAVTRLPAFLAAVRAPAVLETRFAATRPPLLRAAVFLAPTRDLSLRRADFALRFFSPPPVTLFTVAQARASAVFSADPRPS